jgi:hypothetical protein
MPSEESAKPIFCRLRRLLENFDQKFPGFFKTKASTSEKQQKFGVDRVVPWPQVRLDGGVFLYKTINFHICGHQTGTDCD